MKWKHYEDKHMLQYQLHRMTHPIKTNDANVSSNISKQDTQNDKYQKAISKLLLTLRGLHHIKTCIPTQNLPHEFPMLWMVDPPVG